MRSFTRTDWLLIAVLWLLATACNIGKAYHVDDTAHLEIAQWIQQHPLSPMSGPLNWSGLADPIHATNQPHLFFYLLAGWAGLFGWSEVSTHLLLSLFSLAAIVGFHLLAVRLIPSVRYMITALLVLGPAFLVLQNLMVDVPLLAVWMWFFVLLLLGQESERQTTRFVAMALLASAACLIKYSSLALVPILLLALVAERRKQQAWVLAIPALVLGLWSLFNYLDYGALHIMSRGDKSTWLSLTNMRTLSWRWLMTLGGVLPLGFMGVAVLLRRGRWLWAAAVTLLIGGLALLVAGVFFERIPQASADRYLSWYFAVNGVLLLCWFLFSVIGWLRSDAASASPAERRVMLYLVSWVIVTTGFYLVLSPFIAARHVLLVVPPLLLMLGRLAARASNGKRVLAVGLAVTVPITAGLAVSDWRFADFYRRQAAQIAAALPDGAVVATSGHWGWQWYAAQQGMRQVDVSNPGLAPGDYFVVADGIDHQDLRVPVPLVLQEVIVSGTGSGEDPWSILCTANPARLYATAPEGPWSISRSCVGSISIYRVAP